MGVTLVTLPVMTPAKEESSNAVLVTEGLPGGTNKSDHFNYKGEQAKCSDAFKRGLGFCFTEIIST